MWWWWLQRVIKSHLVTQPCPTLRDLMDCSLPGSSIHGILQARILEEVVISFTRETSRPRDLICIPSITGRLYTGQPHLPINLIEMHASIKGWHPRHVNYTLVSLIKKWKQSKGFVCLFVCFLIKQNLSFLLSRADSISVSI